MLTYQFYDVIFTIAAAVFFGIFAYFDLAKHDMKKACIFGGGGLAIVLLGWAQIEFAFGHKWWALFCVLNGLKFATAAIMAIRMVAKKKSTALMVRKEDEKK